MMSTTDTIPSFEVTSTVGVVEAVLEQSFSAVSISGMGLVRGVGLNALVSDATDALAMLAAELGANAIVGLRYAIEGRELERASLHLVSLSLAKAVSSRPSQGELPER